MMADDKDVKTASSKAPLSAVSGGGNILENLKSYIKQAREYELSVSGGTNESLALKYGVLMLAYLLLDELQLCQMVWRRIPAGAKKNHSFLGTIWTLGKSLLQKNRKDFFSLAKTAELPERLTQFLQYLLTHVRNKMNAFVATSYKSISLKEYAQLIGFGVEEATKEAVGKGWGCDESWVYPKKIVVTKDAEAELLPELESLSRFMMVLETK
mmetsp:Transcript_28635/g.39953  ORF Transcript_28635/g.39953 Transcript_28635/m.39953 type:complete len:212 (+) Transcript_28635:30-665(+)